MTEKLDNIVKVIKLNAPIEKVWESVTDAEKIATWLMPNDFKPIEGHPFTIQSPFGPSPCKVEQVNAPNFVRFAWDTDGWFVTFELKELGEQTEFTLTHGGWKEASHIIPKANIPAEAVRKTMDGGWTMIVTQKLKETVESQ
ncbi:SRPBCC family protein [Lysinibacillus pakistanensis]|uniref:SRPBCC domain-containing protein n=1 Tax=Lysinibacillus pakistanensis TaxID=759811 RepID=A0AAX3WZ96_9BACI|nr:SRPBCC domain-containing protein [Lysinibacillus pakistanensis]MDM5231425.1 SRPBCC domain-containing protein [Lysinibacillus pakistanensis]WHY46973.1 SRPBCC domain-containing protein [Lysinibacillus pakistanensis]WHY51986.1 SRPBCC domain-containing protein [Lysinibacillus pakistanensis]